MRYRYIEKNGPKKKKIIGVILRLNKLPQPEVVVVVGVGDTLVVTAAVDDDVEFVTTFMVVPLGVDDGCIVSLMHFQSKTPFPSMHLAPSGQHCIPLFPQQTPEGNGQQAYVPKAGQHV